MADTIALVEFDVGAPLAPVLFATDAMGATEADCGGYAVVGTEPPRQVIEQCFEAGNHPRLTVVKLTGDVDRLLGKDRPLTPKIPYSPLPRIIFDKSVTQWQVICKGRWHYEDRIELGDRGEGHAEAPADPAHVPVSAPTPDHQLGGQRSLGRSGFKRQEPRPSSQLLMPSEGGHHDTRSIHCGTSLGPVSGDASR
jgi:hypothetical protein